MKADINKIREYEEYLSQINREKLENVQFYDGDKLIKFDRNFLEEFKYRGLCNTDLILDSDFFNKALGNDKNDEGFNPVEESL